MNTSEPADRYYCDEHTAVPLRIMARGLSQTLPTPFAYLMAAYIRFRGRMKWYFPPICAMKAVFDTKVVSPEQLSPRAWSKWAPYLEQLRDLHFTPIAHRLPDVIGAREQCTVLLLHADGKTVGTLEWMRNPGTNGPQEDVSLELNSYADQDPDILTGAINPVHLAYAEILNLTLVDSCFMSNQTPIRKLFELHKQRVGNRAMTTLDHESAQTEHIRRAKRRFEWMLKTGFVRLLTPREVEAVRMCTLNSQND